MIDFEQLAAGLAADLVHTAKIKSSRDIEKLIGDAFRRGLQIGTALRTIDELDAASSTQSSTGSAAPWITKH